MTWGQDVHYALRALASRKLYALASIAVLAIAIGVRMALGARAADIRRMILRQGGKLIAIGLVIGIAGAIGLGRVLASQLDRVGSFDATVLVLTVVGLGAPRSSRAGCRRVVPHAWIQ